MPSVPLHFLITAGPTREAIDDVRDWGNIFTGKTGLDIARAFLDLGNVTLLTSNLQHAHDFDGYSGKGGMMGVETFKSYADLQSLLEERMTSDDNKVDVVAMTAAVADYKPTAAYQILDRTIDPTNPSRETWIVENVSAGKVKSIYNEIAIAGTRTPKLIDRFRTDWHFKGLLIKFKLEVGLADEQLIAVAATSRRHSDADLIVANTSAMARPQDGTEGGGYMIDDTGSKWIARSQMAAQIKAWAEAKLKSQTP